MNKLNGIPSLEMNKVKNIYCKLSDIIGKGWDIPEKDDYINITEWVNGEGFDITIGNRIFTLSYYELEAIEYLIKKMEYEFKK